MSPNEASLGFPMEVYVATSLRGSLTVNPKLFKQAAVFVVYIIVFIAHLALRLRGEC